MSRWTALKLAGWLGPWAGTAAPKGVIREELLLRKGPSLRAWLYRPKGRPLGTYLVVHGLHFQGPADPRLDRVCRVLAGCGLLVVAPFLPDYLDLRLSPSTAEDVGLAFEAAERAGQEAGTPAPAVFSISFGSYPASVLAGREEFRERVRALLLFGGFADFGATVRFCVTGAAEDAQRRVELARDPLNSPVVYLNLLPYLELPGDKRAVAAAWREMVERTWGRPELKEKGAREPIAHEIAARLRRVDAELFLVGCGLAPGSVELLEEGLSRAGDAFSFADPRPHLARVKAPVAVIHGRDDDVIPFLEAQKLRDALPEGHPHRVLLTGFYGHAGAALPSPRELLDEVRTLLAVVRTMACAPLLGHLGP